MENSWLDDRITATKTLIEGAEDLLSVLILEDTPTNRQYTLNTGQSVVTVMKRDLSSVEAFIERLYNRLATLEARRSGATYQAKPI